MKYLFFALSLSALLLASCSKSSDTATPNISLEGKDTMIVTIDGNTYISQADAVSSYITSTILEIRSPLISITMENPSSGMTYNVGGYPDVQDMSYEILDSGKLVLYQWHPSLIGGTRTIGNVTIQQYDGKTIKATFNATLRNDGGYGSRSVSITNGTVYATIQ